MTKKRPKPRPDVLCGAPRSSDRRRHAHSACSRPKSAILCLFRENSKCVYTVNVKIRLKATLDFSTFESRPPFPRRCAPGRAPRASQGTAAARRKFSANMKIEPNFAALRGRKSTSSATTLTRATARSPSRSGGSAHPSRPLGWITPDWQRWCPWCCKSQS